MILGVGLMPFFKRFRLMGSVFGRGGCGGPLNLKDSIVVEKRREEWLFKSSGNGSCRNL